MEVCRKCKQEIKSNEKYIDALASWTLGFLGKGRYHLDCWNKSKKIGIGIGICGGIVFFLIFIIIVIIMLSKF